MSLELFLQDPYTFATENIILPPARGSKFNGFEDPKAHKQSGVFKFAFIKMDSRGKKSTGEDCFCYRIERADAYNTQWPTFMSYFCFYEADEMHMLVVDNDASIMLTPAMNGCSFGVGSATNSGARLVAHVNESRVDSTVEGKKLQAANQAEMLQEAFANPSIMGPDTYMTKDNIFGTTIGFRQNRQWSFFMQNWKRSGAGVYTLKQVRDIM